MEQKDLLYIDELEAENEMLRKQIQAYAEVIDRVWTSSPTLGLLPEIDFFPVGTEKVIQTYYGQIAKMKQMRFRSVKAVREYILSQKVNHRVYIELDEDDKIFTEDTVTQGIEQQPEAYYTIRFVLGKKDGTDIVLGNKQSN